jgi:hypothetical protein
MIQREQEAARQKREDDEIALAEAKKRAVQDKSRQQNMMKAQEDYWSKKLAGERERKLQKLGQEDKAKEERRVTEEARLKAAVERQEFQAAQQLLREEQEELDVSENGTTPWVVFALCRSVLLTRESRRNSPQTHFRLPLLLLHGRTSPQLRRSSRQATHSSMSKTGSLPKLSVVAKSNLKSSRH